MKREIPWYKHWFDENYLHLYNHRDVSDAELQIDLIINTLNLSKNSKILDLGCGEGRYLSLFEKLGLQVFGLDLSEKLIKIGKNKCSNLKMIVGDMRAIPGHFDVILSLFTSFGYFEDDRENERVLESVNLGLNKNGVFWLDFLNPPYIEQNLVPESVNEISFNCTITENRKVCNSRIIKDIVFIENGMEKHYRESVRLYSRAELELMLKRAGILPYNCFGDYKGSIWSENSERMILCCRKRD